ncbi:hypothetical protein NKH18_06735 [Streptomyces sp. M10(2022)]
MAGAVLSLLLGAWLPRHRQWITGTLAAAACTAGIIAAAVAAPDPAASAFGDALALDPLTSAGRIIILGGGLIVLALSLRPLHSDPGKPSSTSSSCSPCWERWCWPERRTCCCCPPDICSPPSPRTPWPGSARTRRAPKPR